MLARFKQSPSGENEEKITSPLRNQERPAPEKAIAKSYWYRASLTPKETAKSIARFASEKKAENIIVLDMRKVVNYCDYFVLCSGNTDRQARAIADHIHDKLKELNIRLRLREGFSRADWVIVDTGDVVAHVFQKRVREFYQLEYLWQDAKPVAWEA